MNTQPANKSAADPHAAKRRARLCAVQGLYQIALSAASVKDVMHDFRDPTSAAGHKIEGDESGPMDEELFGAVVNGVTDNQDSIDDMIAGAVDAKLSPARLEILLRAILRAGVFELHHHGKIPAGVIINDYVDVAHVFFNDREPGLVNGILDKLAKNLR